MTDVTLEQIKNDIHNHISKLINTFDLDYEGFKAQIDKIVEKIEGTKEDEAWVKNGLKGEILKIYDELKSEVMFKKVKMITAPVDAKDTI